ncbi:MAG: hypothetical protein ACLFSJ_00725 [Halorhodospira sp.]
MHKSVATTAITSALFLLAVGSAHAEEEKPSFSDVAGDDDNVKVEEAVEAGVPESVAKREDIDDDGKLSETDWSYVTMEEDSGSEQPEGQPEGGTQGQSGNGTQGQSGGDAEGESGGDAEGQSGGLNN